MKRTLVLLLSLLLLAGCAPQEEPPVSSPATSAEEDVSPTAKTLEDFLAGLEAEGMTVRDLVPYEEDYLVVAEGSPTSGAFFWYYSKTSLAAPIYWCYNDILRYDILSSGSICRMLTIAVPLAVLDASGIS